MDSLADRLKRLIDMHGPIPVSNYMAEANAHYYATRDPLGAGGDFTTAPEISQMFGELVGLWLAELWVRAGQPDGARYVELGPGRGTLASDALRAMRAAGLEPAVELVETSPALRKLQADAVPAARWHYDLTSLPKGAPLLVVANEFFDALPARQLIRAGRSWHERLVGHDGARFVPAAGPPIAAAAVPAPLREAPEGTILETSPATAAIASELARRIADQGGAALIVDYGHARTTHGETLQAVEKHDYADPWERPGERDLTVHVDFEALGDAARAHGARVFGPVGQGEWLRAMGIDLREASLSKTAPQRAAEISEARERLVSPQQMGTLFKTLALVSPDWPEPEGFR